MHLKLDDGITSCLGLMRRVDFESNGGDPDLYSYKAPRLLILPVEAGGHTRPCLVIARQQGLILFVELHHAAHEAKAVGELPLPCWTRDTMPAQSA